MKRGSIPKRKAEGLTEFLWTKSAEKAVGGAARDRKEVSASGEDKASHVFAEVRRQVVV